jgi:hypothetical protein
MAISFISEDLWSIITKRVKSSSRPCHVAVAYFGRGAAKLLPLPAGSRLVVNASDGAVKSGQTCPDDLIALQKTGVTIHSVANLHAKVFVVGQTAFVGSANASKNSADYLAEAAVQTTDATTVAGVKAYIESLCKVNLGPEELKRLAGIYEPPETHGPRAAALTEKLKAGAARFPDLIIAGLGNCDYPDEEEETVERGERVAKRECQHRAATHEVCSFRWEGRIQIKPGQQVVQVWEEACGKVWVYPPALALHSERTGKGSTRYIWVEYPAKHRFGFDRIAAKLGRGAKTKLLTDGRVKDPAFAKAIREVWKIQ